MSVWCVWTESGEYEQFSRNLRGIFATQGLADAHADQLRAAGGYDKVEVVQDAVLDTPPVAVPYVRYAAHIRPNGTEDTGLGYHRETSFQTWSNELQPLDSSRVDPWSRPGDADLYIEVIGSNEGLVAAEYARLLAALRESSAVSSAVSDKPDWLLTDLAQSDSRSE